MIERGWASEGRMGEWKEGIRARWAKPGEGGGWTRHKVKSRCEGVESALLCFLRGVFVDEKARGEEKANVRDLPPPFPLLKIQTIRGRTYLKAPEGLGVRLLSSTRIG